MPGYVLWVVVSLRLRDPILRQIEVSEMPHGIRDGLRPLIEEMQEEGLSLVALQHARRPAGDSTWAAVACDSSGATWALAQMDRSLFMREQHPDEGLRDVPRGSERLLGVHVLQLPPALPGPDG